MTEYRYTQIILIVDCLTACWDDIHILCRDWNTSAEHLSEDDRLIADTLYLKLDLNRNARRLHDLTSGINLLAEVQQGQYSVQMMSTTLSEIERIDGRIDNWFERVQSSEDVPVNTFLAHDIYLIRDAIKNVQYIFDPLVADVEVNAPPSEAPCFVPEIRQAPYDTLSPFVDGLQGLFNDSEAEVICVNALSRIDPPLINTAGHWIDSKRGKKSMLVAWWDAATVRGYVRRPANDRQLSRMLNEYFPGLDLEITDAGIFRQNTTTRTSYQPEFLALMPAKKLTKLRR